MREAFIHSRLSHRRGRGVDETPAINGEDCNFLFVSGIQFFFLSESIFCSFAPERGGRGEVIEIWVYQLPEY